MGKHTYSWISLKEAILLVYVYERGRASRYLSGYLIEDNTNKLVWRVNVNGLKNAMRSIEDDNGTTGNIGLCESQ
jgi:hypothetical protein